ncbi:MAG: hypothetical protein Q8S33_05545 [Myxococcales bacterium]|nr:hypothetical protein [Myxococcales bacterium]
MRTLLLLVCALAFGCSPSTLAGPCSVTCDCPVMNAPIRCPGEWSCNAQKTCEYTCKDPCGSGSGDGGCATGDVCNGSICSARSTCR